MFGIHPAVIVAAFCVVSGFISFILYCALVTSSNGPEVTFPYDEEE